MITMSMKRALSGIKGWHILMLIFMLSFIAVAPPSAQAQIPRYINYQGKLTDANDDPVTGDVNITIRIYGAVSGGTALWTETQKTTVTRGIFSILLGNSTVLDSLSFNDPYWYSVEVESDGEMTPRQRLTSVGYAINADKLDGYDASAFLASAPSGALSLTGGANQNVEINPTGTGDVVITIDATSGDFRITNGTTNFVVVDNATGDVSLTQDLTVTGDITLDGSITDTSGAVTIADALTQSGSSNQVTFAGNVDANNGLDVTGALTVSGATTLSSALDMNSNIDLDYSGTSAAMDVTQTSTGPAAQFSGGRVVVGASEASNANALSTGELYVLGDLEVDGTLYGNVSSSGSTALGATTLSSLTVTGTSDLQGNISNSAGTVTVADYLSVTQTDSSTSGTVVNTTIQPTYQDAGTNSTTAASALKIAPTINYTGTTKTGSYTGLKIAATETSLPTGTNYLIDAYAGADGTTQKFYVDNSGNAKIFGALNMNSQKITGLAEPTAATDAATKNYADAVVPASAGGWTDGGTGVYLITSTDNVGIGTTSTGTYKLNVSGSTNTTSLYIGGTQVTATAAELSKLAGASANVTAANLGTLTGASNADTLHTHTATGVTSGVILTAPSSDQTIQPTAATVTPLILKGAASQSDNLLEFRDSSSNLLTYVDPSGRMFFDLGSGDYALAIAESLTAGAQNSAAKIYFGRNATDDWEVMGYDPTLGTKGKFTFSAPLQVEASSPTGITFVEKDSQGVISKSQDFTYDPSADQFSFSGGVFAQQFKNLIKNSSFEAFSAFQTFHGLDPNYATGTFDTTMGGMRNTTYGYEGGWENFEPDEWNWVGGDVFQNAPMSFKSGYNVAATSYTQDYTQGVSAVRIKDVMSGSDAANIGTGKDGELKQTISGLEPGKVYSVGIDMRVDPNTATATKGIVNIVNGLNITGLTLNGNITPSTTTINITQEIAGSIARLPSNGFLWIEPDTADAEQVSYTGKIAGGVSGVTRGINGTTARNHNSGVPISCAFRPLEATTTNASAFTTFKGQFITDEMATSVEIHLIARSTDPAQGAGTVLFDSAQVVAGKSVPEYQTGTITDSGDQTIYGALRIGRASDEKGGILSVDKFVRTRGVEFFTNDPGFTGQKGGFSGFGGINPPTASYNTTGTVGTLTLFTSGNYTGTTQFMNFYVQITGIGTPNQFKWYYDDGTGLGYRVGNNDVAINAGTSDIALGTTGVNVRFSVTTGGQVGDRWDFFATRMDPAGYNSFGATTAYAPSATRIFKDPDMWSSTYNELVFEDSGNKVSITDLVNLIGVPSKIDPAWQEWNGTVANSGGMGVWTSGNYTGTQEKFFKIQIVTTGTAGTSSGTFQWRADIAGTAGTWSSPISMSTIEQPIGAEGVRVGFSENPMANDPATRLSDAYITGGAIGDTWGFGVHPSSGTSSLKTNPTATQTISPTGASAANVTPLAIQMAAGQAVDPFVIKDSAGTPKFRVDTAGNVIATSISGTVEAPSLPTAGANTAGIIPSTGLTNAMVSDTAAIAYTKLANLSSGNILVGNATNQAASVAMTGDVTISNTGLTSIGVDKVKDTMIDFGTGAGQVSTTDITEGTNLYYTDARVDTRLDTDQTITGTWTFSNAVTVPQTPTSATDAASKAYVDAGIAGLSWKEAVLSLIANNTIVPPTETSGDRYLLSKTGGAPHANWDGASAGDMVQFNGASWVKRTPIDGDAVFVEDVDTGYVYTGSAWTPFTGATAYTWGNGLGATGTTIDVNTGNGIQISSDAVAVKLKTTSGLEVDGNGLAIADAVAGTGLSILNKVISAADSSATNEINTIAADSGGATSGLAVTLAGGTGISTSRVNDTVTITNSLGTSIESAEITDGTIAVADIASAAITKPKLSELASSADGTGKTIAIAAGDVYVSGNALKIVTGATANFAAAGNCAYTAIAGSKYIKGVVMLDSAGTLSLVTAGSSEVAGRATAEGHTLTYTDGNIPIAEVILYTTGVGAGSIANIEALGGAADTKSYIYKDVRPFLNLGAGQLFKTVSVATQSDVVADTSTDTLTFAAGANISITTNADTDTITITGGGAIHDQNTDTGTAGDSFTIGDASTNVNINAGSGTFQLASSGMDIDTSGNITNGGNYTGAGAVTVSAAGTNQNVILTPSGTGYTLLNGNVGIGTTIPGQKLHITGAIKSATDTTGDADGYLYLGNDGHYLMWDDNYVAKDYAGNDVTGWFKTDEGMSVKNLELRGSSPAVITFGSGTDAKQLQFDSATQEFSFTGGKLKQQFQNLLRDGNFESYRPSGWYSNRSYWDAMVSTAYYKYGSQSLQVYDDSTGSAYYMCYYVPQSDRFRGKSLTLSIWVRCHPDNGDVNTSAKASIGLSTGSTITSQDITLSYDSTNSTAWRNFTFTYNVPNDAYSLYVYLYGAAGGSNGSARTTDTAGGVTGSSSIYYDGVTLVEGKLALEYGPSPIYDTGDQVISGNLAIGANTDPYSTYGSSYYYRYPRLVFGEPDSNFGGYYGGWSMGSGEISFRRLDDGQGTFMFSRPIMLDKYYMSSWNKPSLFIGSKYWGSADKPDYAWSPDDAYIKGVVEVDGGIYGDIMSYYGGVGKSANLLTYSEDFLQPVWVQDSGMTVASGLTAPTGTNTACSLQSGNGYYLDKSIQQTVSCSGSTTYTFSVYFAPSSGYNYAYIYLKSNLDSYWSSKYVDLFDTSSDSPWRRFAITHTTPAGANQITAKIEVKGGYYSTSTIKIWGAQLRAGSTPGVYLKTTSAAVNNPTALFHGDGSGLTNLAATNMSGTSAITGITGNVLTINEDLTGTPSEDMSLTFNRGSATDAVILWDENPGIFDVNQALKISNAKDLTVTGQIIAGSSSNTITTAAGLLDATKLSGTIDAARLPSDGYGATYVNVSGDTMTGALNLASNGLAVGTSQLVVSGGNVGIGTTAPGVKLDVVGAIRSSNGLTVTAGVVSLPDNSITDAMAANDITLNSISQITARSHTSLSDIGTNTHAAIDTHLASASNPHSVTKTQVGLGNVDNVQQMPLSYLDATTTLGTANDKVPSQNAIKVYVDNSIAGLKWKQSVRAATIDNGALASAFTNGQVIDGITLSTGDRILIKAQTTGSENGIHVVNASGSPARAADSDTAVEIKQSAVFVEEGAVNSDTAWVLTNDTITLGSTGLTFTQFTGAAAYTWGNGLSNTGNIINVGAGTGISVGADSVAVDTSYLDTNYVNPSGDTMTGTLTLSPASGYALVTTAGNVGIGTTGPVAKLEVSGTVKSTGAIIGSLTGVLKASSGTVSAATGGTDYENPLTFNNPLSRSVNAVDLSYNSTNLKLTTGALNTIQDIATSSSPTFAGGTITANFAVQGTLTPTTISMPLEANITWGTAGKAVLTAEYPNAIIYGDGSANSGTMAIKNTADANWRNYYEWSSQQTVLQDYIVVVRYELPQDFSGWSASNAIKLGYVTQTALNTDNKIDVVIYKAGSASAIVSSLANVSATWSEVVIDDSNLGAWSAGDTLIIEIKAYSKSANFARVGDITLNYTR